MTRAALLFVLITLTGAMAAGAEADQPTPRELISAATTRPWPGETYPTLPTLSSEMTGRIGGEIARPEVRRAFELLDARQKRNTDWFEAVSILEKEKAVWSLQGCLVHCSEDVQIKALRALGRLKNAEAVPFLLIYGQYKAVGRGGSESATIHGIVQESIAAALSSITGVEVKLRGQDVEGLKGGLQQWTKWMVEHPLSERR